MSQEYSIFAFQILGEISSLMKLKTKLDEKNIHFTTVIIDLK